MSPELVLQFLAWNAEADSPLRDAEPPLAQRPGTSAPSSTPPLCSAPCPGCLLEQVCAAPQCHSCRLECKSCNTVMALQ